MIKSIDYEQIDKGLIDEKSILIDVRSPKEYKNATIPGAVNIPIFNDEQRETIGTVYVHESVDKAKRLGVEAASKNLPLIYEKLEELKKDYSSFIFFCARGGMRSSSLVSLISTIGINAIKLEGGYKRYRGYINRNLPTLLNGIKFIVLHGNTGVGKTNILNKLRSAGHNVLDLEKCANHRGSLLGGVGLGVENSQKYFESLVYETLKSRNSDLVFVEGESKRIGHIIIPEFIYTAMEKGVHLNITAPIEYRVDNILKEYLCEDNYEIIEGLNKLRKYISSSKIDEYIRKIQSNNYKEVVEELMVKYYDPMYENKKYNFAATINNINEEITCSEIVSFIKRYRLI